MMGKDLEGKDLKEDLQCGELATTPYHPGCVFQALLFKWFVSVPCSSNLQIDISFMLVCPPAQGCNQLSFVHILFFSSLAGRQVMIISYCCYVLVVTLMCTLKLQV